MTFTNTTVVGSGGSANIGGGIDNAAATLTLTNDTLWQHSGVAADRPGGTTYVQNTIIGAGNSDGGDGDCVASGRPDDINGENSSTAITHDLGDNIDQDGSCDLTGPPTSRARTPTWHRSSTTAVASRRRHCCSAARPSAIPQLGVPSGGRPRDPAPRGQSDIGAFEAVKHGVPTATTGDAQGVTDTGALLGATGNLDGRRRLPFRVRNEPASSHQPRGLPPPASSSDTAETRRSRISTPARPITTRGGGQRDRVHARAQRRVLQDRSGPPVISNVNVESVTDTTATIDFSIDPQGAEPPTTSSTGPTRTTAQKHRRSLRTSARPPGPRICR